KNARKDLPAVDSALLFFWRASCIRFWLAPPPGRRDARRLKRRRLPPAAGLRPDPDRSGFCLDHCPDRHDAGDRDGNAAAAGASFVSLAAGRWHLAPPGPLIDWPHPMPAHVTKLPSQRRDET